MTSEPDEKRREEQERESGMPGGGAGRTDTPGHTGVYPMSGPLPPGEAKIRTPAAWGQGERGAAGYEDHGGSELTIYGEGQLVGGLTAGPSGEPTPERASPPAQRTEHDGEEEQRSAA
jgi:hypothetical protein